MPINPTGEIIVGDDGSPAFGIPDHIATPQEWQDYLGRISVEVEKPRGRNKWGIEKIKVKLIDALVDQACKAFVAKGASLPIELTDQSFQVQEFHARRTVVVTIQHKIKGEDFYVVLPVVLPEQEVAWLRVTGRWKTRRRDPLQALRMPSVPEAGTMH